MKYKHEGIWTEMLPSLSWSRNWHNKEDNSVLCEYASKLKSDEHILEIGSAEGQSTISMLLASESFCVAIDPYITTNLLTNIKALSLGARVVILPTTSEGAVLPPIKFGLVFIDGVHTYDMVKHDLEKFSQTGAQYIVLHDTIKPELHKAVKEFVEKGTYEKIEERENITVLSKLSLEKDE